MALILMYHRTPGLFLLGIISLLPSSIRIDTVRLALANVPPVARPRFVTASCVCFDPNRLWMKRKKHTDRIMCDIVSGIPRIWEGFPFRADDCRSMINGSTAKLSLC
ncbi:hypothetical protein OF83DRAFT_121439 [Amylostereum chailletii]|nr:hypothetical protein OF83DRAFT_121439 [Amylostereum chailletii]